MNSICKTAVAASLALAGSLAAAVPITYTFTGLTTGSLSGQAFSDQPLTVVITGDTSNVSLSIFGSDTPGINAGLSNALTLGSLLSTSITEPGLYVFNNQPARVAGFGTSSKLDLFNVGQSDELASYNLASNIGPLSFANAWFISQFNNVSLANGGALTISSATGVTFGASLVPEPATYALWLLGLAAVGVVARRPSAA